jgi:hypothetical protein
MRRLSDHIAETTPPGRDLRPDPWSCLIAGLAILVLLLVALWP